MFTPQRVMCHMWHVTIFFFFGLSDQAYRWRICYQWGLPRLVWTFRLGFWGHCVFRTKNLISKNNLRKPTLEQPENLNMFENWTWNDQKIGKLNGTVNDFLKVEWWDLNTKKILNLKLLEVQQQIFFPNFSSKLKKFWQMFSDAINSPFCKENLHPFKIPSKY